MGTYDGLPSLVEDMRSMKARIAELERQQLAAAKQAASDAQDAVNALALTDVWHTTLSGGLTITTAEQNVPGWSITVDALGRPMIVFMACSVQAPTAASGWKQVLFRIYDGSSIVDQRGVNIQGNADVQTISMSCGVKDPALVEPGSRNWRVTAQLTAQLNAADPNPSILGGTFDLLRIGTLAPLT